MSDKTPDRELPNVLRFPRYEPPETRFDKEEELDKRLQQHAAEGLSVDKLAERDKHLLLGMPSHEALEILTTAKGNVEELIEQARKRMGWRLLSREDNWLEEDDENVQEEQLSTVIEALTEEWGHISTDGTLTHEVDGSPIPLDSLTDEEQEIVALEEEIQRVLHSKETVNLTEFKNLKADLLRFAQLTGRKLPEQEEDYSEDLADNDE